MLIAAAFWLFLLSAITVVWLAGGKEGRLVAAACFLAATLTLFSNTALGFLHAKPILISVDVGLLILTTAIALKSKTYWPIWFTGFQTIAVSSNLAMIVFSGRYANLYGNLAGFWALPALGAAVAGVLIDRRANLARLPDNQR